MSVAMIMAAGFGTRLLPLSSEKPKPLFPVGTRPLLSVLLEAVSREGATRVGINVCHLADQIEAFASTVTRLPLRLEILREPTLLGTAGGLRNACEHGLMENASEPLRILNGDTLFQPNWGAALRHHRQSGAAATLILRQMPEDRAYGPVYVDAAGRVVSILAPLAEPTVDGGVYMFTGAHLIQQRLLSTLPTRGCVVRDGYVRWLQQGERIAAVVDTSAWYDLGTVASYFEINMMLASGKLSWPGIPTASTPGILAKTARIGEGAVLDQCVVSEGASIAPDVTLRRVVAWEGAVIDHDLQDAIVTAKRIHRVV